ncbi:hypothetical protein Q5O24_05260 [Eubacteriaceae bacterium ES3]|nr:hypothetical protein Q5O24_05260 [Eubacteriaceae bacterium ES3]
MLYYICIDDTDNIDSIGTGTIADQLRQLLKETALSNPSLVTRHQLFIHPDIPYTSHNSSMCFTIEADKNAFHQIIELCSKHLLETAADGSDPGLCVLPFKENENYSDLIEFGKSAKASILNKDMAYACALKYDAHLSEHGGTGDGIIGALAGVGLRLNGTDGEVKASLKNFTIGSTCSIESLKELPEINVVRDFNSKEILPDDTVIKINQRTKTVFYKNQFVLFVVKIDGSAEYEVLDKANIRKLGDSFYE